MRCVSGWVEGIGGDAGGVASTPSVFLEDQADALSCDFLGRAPVVQGFPLCLMLTLVSCYEQAVERRRPTIFLTKR